jgi:hypothetical protein
MCIFSGDMFFGCLVKIWALNVWWSYGLWKFGFPEIIWDIIKKERKLSIATDHTLNISEEEKMFEKPLDEDDELKVTIYSVNIVYRHSSK